MVASTYSQLGGDPQGPLGIAGREASTSADEENRAWFCVGAPASLPMRKQFSAH